MKNFEKIFLTLFSNHLYKLKSISNLNLEQKNIDLYLTQISIKVDTSLG